MSLSTPCPKLSIAPSKGPCICRCKAIYESDIQQLMENQASVELSEVIAKTGAGSCCTGCHSRIEKVLKGEVPKRCRTSFCDGCNSMACLCVCVKERARQTQQS